MRVSRVLLEAVARGCIVGAAMWLIMLGLVIIIVGGYILGVVGVIGGGAIIAAELREER